MRNPCKLLITVAGLDPRSYATYSSKRGGTLEALRQGLTDAQIQELERCVMRIAPSDCIRRMLTRRTRRAHAEAWKAGRE
jgi:hypothetical protein